MESTHQTPSVILKLMGLDKVPLEHPVQGKQKVLSEEYLQKVASIGFRKKRSSHRHHSKGMSTDEKEESEDVLKVVKTIRRDKHYSPSKRNGKENPYVSGTNVKGLPQQLMDASYVSVNRMPETLVDTISSFDHETSVNSGRTAEQGNLQLQQKMNNVLQKDVHGHGGAGLYEKTFMFPNSQLVLKDETFNSRIADLKANPGKEGNGLNYVSFPSSCKNSHLADGMLREIFCAKNMRVYPDMVERKKISHDKDFGKQSSRSFSKISGNVSVQTGNAANRVLDTASSSFSRGNKSLAQSSDILKPASNVAVNEIQHNSLLFCSGGAYVSSEAKNKTLEQRDVTEKLQAVERHGQGNTQSQLLTISEQGDEARNMNNQSHFGNDNIKTNLRCKVDVKYGRARKVAMTRPLCVSSVIADCHRSMTKDNFFEKYWGLRKNASTNWSTQKSNNQSINQIECSEDMIVRSSSEKSPSSSSYFNNNLIEDNCSGLHKLKNGNDFSVKKPMLPQLSSSGPSPTFIDSQILQETCVMNDEVKNYTHEDRNIHIASPNSSVNWLVSDAKIEVFNRSHNNPTMQQSESTALQGDSDSLSHSSYASTQQDASESQEDSVCSLLSGTEPDSLGSFEDAYEPSPVSVLNPSFREDISFSLKAVGADVYDFSEVDDEGFGLNVSSDEDCGNESVGEYEEKKVLVGSFRSEESRDFSYVVEVLTEAGTSNRSLLTDFSTWHSAECPISPPVFEVLEKKFGEQQFWKRSERRLLFDRINVGLLEILQPCSYVPTWEKPVSRRLNAELSQDMIEEEMWGMLVSQEKKASKESADNMLGGEISWLELGEGIEDIVREIVKLLIEELAEEIVSLESF